MPRVITLLVTSLIPMVATPTATLAHAARPRAIPCVAPAAVQAAPAIFAADWTI